MKDELEAIKYTLKEIQADIKYLESIAIRLEGLLAGKCDKSQEMKNGSSNKQSNILQTNRSSENY